MTYYNGNPYNGPTPTAPLNKWAHDACLPDDQFTTVMLADFTTGRVDTATGFTVYDKIPDRHQNWPWHWSTVYGAVKPCAYCGGPVEVETGPGIFRPLAPKHV
jgi:hypothetical protein